MCFDTLSSSVWGGKNLKSGLFFFCISEGFVCFFYLFFFQLGNNLRGPLFFFSFKKKKNHWFL